MDINGLVVIGALFGLFIYLLYAIFAYYKVNRKFKKQDTIQSQDLESTSGFGNDITASPFRNYSTQDFLDPFNDSSRNLDQFMSITEINPELRGCSYSNSLHSNDFDD